MSKTVCKSCGAKGQLDYPLIEKERDLEGLDPHCPGYVRVDGVLLRPVWRLLVDRRRGGARGRQARDLEELLVGLMEGERGMVENALVGLFTEHVLRTERGRSTQ